MSTQPLNVDVPRIPPVSTAALAHSPLSAMSLLSIALENNAAIDVIERLAALQRDERNYHANVAFDEALNRCQRQLGRISADAKNDSTKSKYASYAKIDSVVRPIYTAEGFSLSFGERDCPTPGKTRFVAFLSRDGVTREFLKDITPSTQGPKGNDVMTPIHADACADSYAKRYLLKDIFNIAIGDDDTDGTKPLITYDGSPQQKNIARILAAPSKDALWTTYKVAYHEAWNAKDQPALNAYIQAKDARLRELR
jgi:hypothetical protein